MPTRYRRSFRWHDPNPPFRSQFFPRAAIEGGFTFTDLDNGRGLLSDHDGLYGRLEGGFEYSISPDVFIQANAALGYGALSNDLGQGVTSTHNYFQLLANGRGGWNGLSGNLRLHAGMDLGLTHVGAPECEDGLGCGAEFTRNAQLLPIDSWAMNLGLEAGLSTLQGGLGLFARMGWMFGVNPAFDAVDAPEGNPRFGLNIPYLQIGVQAEVFALIRGIRALFSRRPTNTRGAQPRRPGRTPETGGAGEPTPTPSPAPQGMDLVRQRQADIEPYASRISQATTATSAIRTAYAAIEGTTAEAHRDRRVQALEMVRQARLAVEAAQHIAELAQEAEGGIAAISDSAQRSEARRLVAAMQRQLVEARQGASAVYRGAEALVTRFNQETPGEDLNLDFADPLPRGRGRQRRRTVRQAPPRRTVTRRRPPPPPTPSTTPPVRTAPPSGRTTPPPGRTTSPAPTQAPGSPPGGFHIPEDMIIRRPAPGSGAPSPGGSSRTPPSGGGSGTGGGRPDLDIGE